MELKDWRKVFKKGDIVRHVNGGMGEIRDLQNDWSTTPPTVVATVQVINTIFPDTRKIPVYDLVKVEEEEIDEIIQGEKKVVLIQPCGDKEPYVKEVDEEGETVALHGGKMPEFVWMEKAVKILGKEFGKAFPKAEKGEWKYFLFNTVHWD